MVLWTTAIFLVCAVMVIQAVTSPGVQGLDLSVRAPTGAAPPSPAPANTTNVATMSGTTSKLVSWADTPLSFCKKDHPSMVFPLRISELDENLACSQSVLGPFPNAKVPGFYTPSVGGTLPPKFGLYNMQLANDPADGYMVLLGATGNGSLNGTQTWVFQRDTWTHLNVTNSPESCMGSVMAYDSFDGYVLYFAGGNFGSGANCVSAGQTWSFHAGTWTELYPATSPPVRLSSAMTNDTSDGYMVLFGGACNEGVHLTLCNDTWKYRAGTWTNITKPGGPAGRAGAGMTYDLSDGYVLMFGGTAWPVNMIAPLTLTDTWRFHNGTWTQIPIGGVLCGGPSQPSCGLNAPPGPFNDGLTYDASDGYALYTCAEDNTSAFTQDGYWTYHAGIWTDLNNWSAGPIDWVPSNRIAEGLSYDWGDGYAVMFGGVGTNWNLFNDTWTFHLGLWTNLSALNVSAGASYPSGVAPFTDAFHGSAGGGTGPYNFSWNFGDGSAVSYLQDPNHTFTTPGNYSVVLTVTDQMRRTATAHPLVITVTGNPPLTLSVSASPVCGSPPLNVTFGDSPSGGSPPYTYFWNFSDGSYAYTQSPTHVFSASGNFTVTTVVTDSHSHTATQHVRIFVGPGGCTSPVISSFTASPSTITVGNSTVLSVSVAGGYLPYSFTYDSLPWGCVSTNASSLYCTPASNGTGNYIIKVFVTDAASQSVFASTNLTVNPSTGFTITSFSATPDPVTVGTSTTLSVTVAGGISPLTFSFGGLPPGCSSINASVLSCTPTTAGTYDVTSTVTDSHGSAVSRTLVLTVNGGGPSISSFLISPDPISLGNSITLSANVSGGVAPLSYNWSGLPSGCNASNAPSMTCTPTAVGNFTVTITVIDAAGRLASASAALTVIAGGPLQAVIEFNTPNTGPAPLSVEMTGEATGGSLRYTYVWNFGDGASATGVDTVHTFLAPSGCAPQAALCSYNVSLTVTDSAGAVAISRGEVTITSANATGLHAAILFDSPTSGFAPLTVTVAGNASGGKGPYTYLWNFGDGGSGNGSIVSHTYASTAGCSAGATCVRDLTMTVKDSAGTSIVYGATVNIWPNGTRSFSSMVRLTPSTGVVPLPVAFDANASGGQAPYTFVWSFGDGFTATGTMVQHTYAAAGTYTVVLTAVDANGLVSQSTSTVIADPVPPTNESGSLELSISESQTVGPAPLFVQFTGVAEGGRAPYSFAWNFGDGISASGASVVHPYFTPGVYVSTLFVIDGAGDEASSGVFVTVSSNGTASIENGFAVSVTAFKLHGSAPLTLTFFPAIQGGFAPYALNWSFGDGTSVLTESQGPITHTYHGAGTYYPSLTVTDAKGVKAVWTTEFTGTGHPVTVTGSSSPPNASWVFWVILVVVVASALLVLAAISRSRRGSRPLRKSALQGTVPVPDHQVPPDRPTPVSPNPPIPPKFGAHDPEQDPLRDLL